MEEKRKYTIGVDLGTTNTCAAIYDRETEKITYLDLEPGSNTMPSAVRFVDGDPDEVVVGKLAKRYAIVKYKEVFTSFKTLMQDENWMNDPAVYERYKLGDRQFTPTDMAERILSYVYKVAQQTEFAATEPLDNILICVPAASNAYYIKEVLKAAEAAGFGDKDELGQVIKDADGRVQGITIVKEPIAAAYSYGLKNGFFDSEKSKCQNIMVYDFGGGTFDVSILKLVSEKDKAPVFELMGTRGVTHLGGDDIDKALMGIAAKQFSKDYEIDLLDPTKDNKGCTKKEVLVAQSVLKELCERAKIDDFASGASEAKLEQLSIIHDNVEDEDRSLDIVITREHFLEAIKPLLDKTFECVDKALAESNLTLDDINRFVLVGGSCKGPWVFDAVKNYIGKDPYLADNVDVIVAEGAAYKAGGVVRIDKKSDEESTSTDDGFEKHDENSTSETGTDKSMTTHYYGVELRGGTFVPLIEKGLVFDEEHTSYSGSIKCTNPNDSGFLYITGWTTQEDVLERDEQGNPIREDDRLVSNYSVHYVKQNGEHVFQPLGQFSLEIPKAEPHSLDVTVILTILNDNSLKLEVKVGDDEPKIQTW